MMEYLHILSEPWAIRAMIVSSLVGIMCGTLGCFLVLRNMSLIGDALSHAILPGIYFSFVFFGYSTLGFFFGATVAGMLTAVGITWVQDHVKTKNDAAIGIIFTAMFSIGVIGISALSRTGAHLDLKDFLFGNVLGISDSDIILTSIITIYTLISIIVFYRYLFVTTFQPTIATAMGFSTKTIHYFFMLLLSVAVVSSLGAVGVILVVAMLITPAATALLLSDNLKKVLVISAVVGLLSALVGFLVSVRFETTPGPAMTLVATSFYMIAVAFSPSKGLVFKYIQRLKQKKKIVKEDILRQVIKAKGAQATTITQLKENLGLDESAIHSGIQNLKTLGLLQKQGQGVVLSDSGRKKANDLVRAHRLWETYQVDKMGIDAVKIHDEADYLEHHLSEELLEEIAQDLGFPENDPHGSPIPPKEKSD